jgi:hypothetical protein
MGDRIPLCVGRRHFAADKSSIASVKKIFRLALSPSDKSSPPCLACHLLRPKMAQIQAGESLVVADFIFCWPLIIITGESIS